MIFATQFPKSNEVLGKNYINLTHNEHHTDILKSITEYCMYVRIWETPWVVLPSESISSMTILFLVFCFPFLELDFSSAWLDSCFAAFGALGFELAATWADFSLEGDWPLTFEVLFSLAAFVSFSFEPVLLGVSAGRDFSSWNKLKLN